MKNQGLVIQEGTSLEELAGDVIPPRYAVIEGRPALVRDVWNDQAELLVRTGGKPALGYLVLRNYQVTSTRVVIPDPTYVYKNGHRFDKELIKAGI